MKCIHCQKDSKYKERTSRKCSGCGHLFAFEPKEKDPITDVFFQSAIDAVSANGVVRWNVDHLYYEVCRRKRPGFKKILPVIVFAFLVSAFLSIGMMVVLRNPLGLIVPLLVAPLCVLGVLAYLSQKFVTIRSSEFHSWYERWCDVHGTPKGVIVRKEAPVSPTTTESDVGDYSFDRAVICDCSETVDLLLANQFHFENNCAILSIDGYPAGPFALIRQMLRRNPSLQVFALHDATAAGCRMAHRLATDPEWFGGHAKVIDVGLRPGNATVFKGLYRPSRGSVNVGEGISADEAKWLTSYNLELAAVRPEQVLKRLFRAVSRRDEKEPADTNGGDDGGVFFIIDSTSFSADAGDGDGGADAFG